MEWLVHFRWDSIDIDCVYVVAAECLAGAERVARAALDRAAEPYRITQIEASTI